MNKRGQFFALGLVLITLFLCATVVFMYLIQQDNAKSSLVSPVGVLEMRDDLEIFEFEELSIIKESLGDGFEGFREKFLSSFHEKDDMQDFIFNDLFFDGTGVREEDKGFDFIENVVYPEGKFFYDDKFFSFSRSNVNVVRYLKGFNRDDVNFPVLIDFEFSRDYEISKDSGGYLINYKDYRSGSLFSEGSVFVSSEDGGLKILDKEISYSFSDKFFSLSEGGIYSFSIGEDSFSEDHSLRYVDFSEGVALFEVSSEPFNVYLEVGEGRYIDVNKDGVYDYRFRLVSNYNGVLNLEKERVDISVESNVDDLKKYFDDNPSEKGSDYYNKYSYLFEEDVVSILDSEFENEDDVQLAWAKGRYEEKVLEDSSFGNNELFVNLPWRKTYEFYDTSNTEGLEYYRANEFLNPGAAEYGVPCGPAALHQAFFYLGKRVDVRDIIAEKQGGFARRFLSIFTHAAVHITWPNEVEKIAKKFGFDVERIKGRRANLETAAKMSTEDSVVILRIYSKKSFLGIRAQHYTVYDTNDAKLNEAHFFSDQPMPNPSNKILELFVIKKKGVEI
jgi:hypothetical protein